MKLKHIILLLFTISSLEVLAQVPLAGDWRYSFKNDTVQASPTYDDTNWKVVQGNQLSWDKRSLSPGSKVVWIRKSIVIPSSLKRELVKTGVLALYLGKIQQEDQTFFNGKLIGETGSSDISRAYLIPEGIIHWDRPNMVAVKIGHWGDVAKVSKEPSIAAATPESVFNVTATVKNGTPLQQVRPEPNVYTCIVNNRSSKKLTARINANFFDLKMSKLSAAEKNVTLNPGENKIEFPFKSPSPALKIRYVVSIPEYQFNSTWNAEYGYLNIPYHSSEPVIAEKAPSLFTPADLKGQQISGWLGERLKANKDKRLYQVDEPALLAGFINQPGVHPWIGEHAGKFLEAACNTYQNTGDAALKIQIDRTAQQLIAAQASDGYLGTYSLSSRWTSWDVWSHKYDLIGLLSYYHLSGYKPALEASKKIGDLLCLTFGDKPGQKDINKAGAHVGMAATSVLDPMTDLYRYTGNKKYLDFCHYITGSYNNKGGPRIISTLDSLGRVDKTANAKAYEMLSNLVGLVKLYRVTGDKVFLMPVLKAWKDITENRLYITGTTSSFEHFQDDHLLPAGAKDNMGEGCVTTTWLQLNYNLLCLFGEMQYVNELERSVYNHLTAAENPQTGCVSYYTPLMGAKPFRCVITCCMSSVPRGIAMIPLFINGKINGNPAFLFYQPGVFRTTLANAAKTRVAFVTQTTFPQAGKVTITVNPATASTFKVLLRVPYWAANYKVSVNGVPQPASDGEIMLIGRSWKKGDRIDLSFSMPVKKLDGGISYPGTLALQRGPQVLVLDNKLNAGSFLNSFMPADFDLVDMPSALPANWIGTQAYEIKSAEVTKDQKLIVVPYADAGQTNGDVKTWVKKQ